MKKFVVYAVAGILIVGSIFAYSEARDMDKEEYINTKEAGAEEELGDNIQKQSEPKMERQEETVHETKNGMILYSETEIQTADETGEELEKEMSVEEASEEDVAQMKPDETHMKSVEQTRAEEEAKAKAIEQAKKEAEAQAKAVEQAKAEEEALQVSDTQIQNELQTESDIMEVGRRYIEDCGSDSGYWEITYSDGHIEYIDD